MLVTVYSVQIWMKVEHIEEGSLGMPLSEFACDILWNNQYRPIVIGESVYNWRKKKRPNFKNRVKYK